MSDKEWKKDKSKAGSLPIDSFLLSPSYFLEYLRAPRVFVRNNPRVPRAQQSPCATIRLFPVS
ncbi:MAG: hypothetical protein ACKPEY_07500, partial [Planctomycetota bacterium]